MVKAALKATMGFAVISDHSVNAREANRSGRGKRAGEIFSRRQRQSRMEFQSASRCVGIRMIEWRQGRRHIAGVRKKVWPPDQAAGRTCQVRLLAI
jgi:hypothetical protein